MRLLVYNIAYGTGCPGGEARRLLTCHRYFRTSELHFRQIVGFANELGPDMIGLVEADSGSWRTNGMSHPDKMECLFCEEELLIARKHGSKYGPRSILNRIPLWRCQTNALLCRITDTEVKRHYFPCGTKKLILERELDGITVFLIHMGLTRATRVRQLNYLLELLPSDKPFALAGDFNTFQGEHELREFMRELKLRNANTAGLATYPAWKPLKQLDYILVSEGIKVTGFEVLPVLFSDHLPILADLVLA